MFSGRWEERLKKDKHGNVFLDFNPDCFKLILNYLRAKKIETPRSKAKKPKPPEDETSNYWNLVDYLGLREEFQFPTSQTLLESSQQPQSNYNEKELGECMNDMDVKEYYLEQKHYNKRGKPERKRF